MPKRSRSLTRPKEYYWQAFCIALLVSACFFIPYMILDKGYFLFYGDFNVQQIPFYKHAHEMVRAGKWFWDFGTDLGTNFIGSYSFYLLGSPFFWLTIPFPTDFVPHLMGPLLILKFSCASLTAYCYLTRFVRHKPFALIGGLLYAFSGFSVYNIFFNHFHEAIVLFPLLLLALELLMTENRRGFFLFMVALCAVANYFFFVGMAVFLFLYYILRALTGEWKVTTGKFFQVGLEAILGVALGAVILLPTALMIIQNSRVSSFPLGWGGILYGRNQIPAYVLQSFFFPPELPARPSFFTDADVKWSSVAGWMPVFSMVGVIGWLQAKKGNWLRRLICVLAVMAFIPILNSAFYAFNYAYYARWFYMPILMMALATAKGLEDEEVNWSSAFKWTAGITLAFIAVIGFFPTKLTGELDFVKDFGLYDKNLGELFWVDSAIAVAGLIVLFALLQMRRRSLKLFGRMAVGAVCVIAVLYSAFFIGMGKRYSYKTDYIVSSLIESNITLEGKPLHGQDDYRIDVYKGMDNVALYLGVSGIQAFHSIVPKSVFDYYDYIGVERVVGSRPDPENYPIRSFLSVKYMFDEEQDNATAEKRFGKEDEYGTYTAMSGFDGDAVTSQAGFSVYKNTYYIPYGFTYDHYATREYSDALTKKERQFLMLDALILDDEQIARYGKWLDNYAVRKGVSTLDENGLIVEAEEVDNYVPSFDEMFYFNSCIRRIGTAAESFETDARGFTGVIELKKDNLVFYSIPFDEGWTATVDGQPAPIEKVNIGFMAVPVTAGRHTIRFTYDPPGLRWGLYVTAGAALLTVLYLIISAIVVHRRRKDALLDFELERAARLTTEQGFGIGVAAVTGTPAGETPAPPAEETVDTLPLSQGFVIDRPADAPAPDAAPNAEKQAEPGIRPTRYAMESFVPHESDEKPAPSQPLEGLGGITPPSILDSRLRPSAGFAAFRNLSEEPAEPAAEETAQPAEAAAEKTTEAAAEEATEAPAPPADDLIEGFDAAGFDSFLNTLKDQAEADEPSAEQPEEPAE